MNRSAPKELNYSDTVPLAIPSSSNRREFTPNNGQVFTPNNANVIRIDINSDNFLDVGHSYLQATLTNTSKSPALAPSTTVNNNYIALDIGPSWIQSLRIESGGVTLEHITSYNKLYSFLQLSQSSVTKNATEYGVMMNGSSCSKASIRPSREPTPQQGGLMFNTNSASGTASNYNWSGNVIQAPHYPMRTVGEEIPTSVIKNNQSYTYTIPLMSALFNAAKYLPLLLVNAGLTIEITIAPGHEVGVCGDLAGSQVQVKEGDPVLYYDTDYSITEVRYVAHLIDLDRSFNQVLRDNMAASGAITLHGTMWRHFQSSFSGATKQPVLNIPARMKSIKSIFSLFRDQKITKGRFVTGVSTQSRITSWQFKVGSVSYPQAPVRISSEGKTKLPQDATDTSVAPSGIGPSYCELLKAFGKLGSTETHTCIGKEVYGCTSESNPGVGQLVKMFAIGYDVESFSKSVIESGIDTASRALPISLELIRAGESGTDDDALQIDTIINDNFVCGDGFFYFNPDGTITPSV